MSICVKEVKGMRPSVPKGKVTETERKFPGGPHKPGETRDGFAQGSATKVNMCPGATRGSSGQSRFKSGESKGR